jgi:hypothetical protein
MYYAKQLKYLYIYILQVESILIPDKKCVNLKHKEYDSEQSIIFFKFTTK